MNKDCSKLVAAAGLPTVSSVRQLSGGCISDVNRLTLADGTTLVAKSHPEVPAGMFQSEAAGLAAIAESGSIRVAQVIHVEESGILLEDLGQGSPSGDFWQRLGEALARMHAEPRDRFGFEGDNYCGATPQCNTPTESGFEFFAQYRLMALGKQAFEQNRLSGAELRQLEFIGAGLERWIPEMPPVLIHGDLWSGNVHCCEDGSPALIDPATHWGWAEAELAMTQLFGGFDSRFYAAYASVGELREDWRERVPLYNLYHLLNHLLLFGGSYYDSVKSILDRYAA